jgi:hypothetical protein
MTDASLSPPRAYSVNAFAQAYGISRAQVYVEINAHRLETYCVGRRRFIAHTDAEDWQQRARKADGLAKKSG